MASCRLSGSAAWPDARKKVACIDQERMEGESRWRHCAPILEREPNATTCSWKRKVIVPAIVLATTLVMLVAIAPPFVQVPGDRGSRVSIPRLLVWSLLAAVLTAVLTACHAFDRAAEVAFPR